MRSTSNIPVTLEEIKAVIDYYYDEGTFWWRKTISRSVVAGKQAGHFREKEGRMTLGYRGMLFDAAELAIFLHTGRIPEFPVRFRDGNPRNLKFSNLVEDVIW